MGPEQTPLEQAMREASKSLTKGLREDRSARIKQRIMTALDSAPSSVQKKHVQKKTGDWLQSAVNSSAHLLLEGAYVLVMGVSKRLEKKNPRREVR